MIILLINKCLICCMGELNWNWDSRWCRAWWKEGKGRFSSPAAPLLSTALLAFPNYVNIYFSFFQELWIFIINLCNLICSCYVWSGCGKFALRALSQCLAREFQAQGIHVAHVVIDGIVGTPRFVYRPDSSIPSSFSIIILSVCGPAFLKLRFLFLESLSLPFNFC